MGTTAPSSVLRSERLSSLLSFILYFASQASGMFLEMTHLSCNMVSASFVIPILSLGSLSTYPLVDTWPIR
jgi:hypothetical protein